MKSAPMLWLDRRSEAEAAPGCLVIETEAQWLRAVCALIGGPSGPASTSNPPASVHENGAAHEAPSADTRPQTLMVRGESLCTWAVAWWRGRGWPCEERLSPLRSLRLLCAAWSDEELRAVDDDLRLVWDDLAQPLSAPDVLRQFYPQVPFAWDAAPSLAHAAAWLLWLDETAIEPRHGVLLEAWAQAWRGGIGRDVVGVEELYASSPQEAQLRLRAWIGAWPVDEAGARDLLARFGGRKSWGVFPLPLPDAWQARARDSARALLARRGLAAWDEARRADISTQAREMWAQSALEWLQAHAEAAGAEVARGLEPHLPSPQIAQLRRLVKPSEPVDIFSGAAPKPPQVLEWARRSYREWRLWQVENGSPSDSEHAVMLARAFGDWFRGFYTDALLGAHAGFLSTRASREVREAETSSVTLWVIADGLGLGDAQVLARSIARREGRLSSQNDSALFCALPTITSLAKPALRYGASPEQAHSDSSSIISNTVRREIDVQGHRDASRALQSAHAGDLVIWKPLEPDKTYHEVADASLMRVYVENTLAALAENIVEAAGAVPDSLSLQVILSTDHGRLLTQSQRVHPAPEGFAPHGRAATWSLPASTWGELNFDGGGLARLGEGVAILDPERFGLPFPVAVSLDEGSFLDAAGRGGGESFPHGGMFPEEVVVPWIVLQRDARELLLQAQASGNDKPGARGVILIEIENPNPVRLQVLGLRLRLGARDERTIEVEAQAPPFDTFTLEVPLEPWPQGGPARAASGSLLLARPDGQEFEVAIAMSLDSKELQSRDDILGDMD